MPLDHQLDLQLIFLHYLLFLGHQLRHIPCTVDVSSSKPHPFLSSQERERIATELKRIYKGYLYYQS